MTVRPGQVLDVDVPLTLTGEVDAVVTMLKDGHAVPVAGVLVEALNKRGEVVGHATSEYDGYVYLDGLPMDDIELRVADKALAEVSASAQPAMLSLRPPIAFRVWAATANHSISGDFINRRFSMI